MGAGVSPVLRLPRGRCEWRDGTRSFLRLPCSSWEAEAAPEPRSACGLGVRAFACESGGAAAGDAHPKELLVLRKGGSSVAYPEWGGQGVAAGHGEVVAFHDLNVVRVTSRRLVALVTPDELARALHVRPTAIIWPMNHLGVDARGDVFFSPSVQIRRSGCWNPLVERTADGKLRKIRASITPTGICQ